jgi:hypothetical protein
MILTFFLPSWILLWIRDSHLLEYSVFALISYKHFKLKIHDIERSVTKYPFSLTTVHTVETIYSHSLAVYLMLMTSFQLLKLKTCVVLGVSFSFSLISNFQKA